MSTGSERQRMSPGRATAFVGVALLFALCVVVLVQRERRRERRDLDGARGDAAPPSSLERAARPKAAPARRPATTDDPLASTRAVTPILDLAAHWRGRLRLAEPELDPALLEALRAAAREVDATTLLAAAGRFATGSDEQCLCLLASAWARGLDAETDAALVAFGVSVGAPLEARDRAGLAAIHGLVLGGRRAAAGDAARVLIGEAWAAPAGAPVLTGLASVRAWFALRDATLEPEAVLVALELDRARYRVSHEAFALAAREAPDVFAPFIFERVAADDEFAREGLAALSDPRWLPELAALLDDPGNAAAAPWVRADAGRGLVAMGTDASLARLTDELRASGPRRESALQALSGWRRTESWTRVVALGDALEGDEEALEAWRRGVERGWRRLRFRRDDDPERIAAATALQRK
ncbi:MAG: hypothetical protein WD226_09580 [Planctomycetota bacterium]